MKRVCIIGLGWLGEQIGDYLNERAYLVSGTTTNADKLESLKPKYDTVFKFDITSESSVFYESLKAYNYYVLTIPPTSNILDYAERLSGLVRHIYMLNPGAKIIYTSSISVYGNTDTEVDESSALNPQKSSAKEIVDFELCLQDNHSTAVAILRLGGLCGHNRHPVRSFSGRKGIKKPKAKVNLVHADDVCRFIHFLIEGSFINGVFNLCSSIHPEKKQYYEWVASSLNLAKPLFDKNDNSKDKTVICKAISNLGFKLKYNSPYDYPELLDE